MVPRNLFPKSEPIADVQTLNKRELFEPTIFSPIDNDLKMDYFSYGTIIADTVDTPGQFLADVSTGLVAGDLNERYFHFYQQEMSTYGVSRFRLSNLTAMPVTSDIVALIPITIPEQADSVLVAMDYTQNIYYLVTCILEMQFPKLFLVKSLGEGIEILQSQAMQTVLTGGEVSECSLIPWTTGE